MKKKKCPVFVTFLENFKTSESHRSTFVVFFDNGEVIGYPQSESASEYQLSTYELCNSWVLRFKEQDKSVPNFICEYVGNQCMAFHSYDEPKLLDTLNPAPNFELKVELCDDTHIFIISGVLKKNYPSIGIYFLTLDGLQEIYIESLLAVHALIYVPCYRKIFVLPRTSNCAGFLIDDCLIVDNDHKPFPRINVPSEHPRYISNIYYTKTHFKKSQHALYNQYCNWPILTWSDDFVPAIYAWKYQIETEERFNEYMVRQFDFCIPARISFISYHPIRLESIGFILETEKGFQACLWDLKGAYRHPIQDNFYLPDDIGEIHSAGFAFSFHIDRHYTFVISTSTGYYEILERKMLFRWKNPPFKIRNHTFTKNGYRFFLDDDNIPYTLERSHSSYVSKDHLEELPLVRAPTFPIIVNDYNGTVETLSALHMFRCDCCNQPLIFPLVSQTEDKKITRHYCSEECQTMHWGRYLAAHEPIFDESD